jgi:hypothetical protein
MLPIKLRIYPGHHFLLIRPTAEKSVDLMHNRGGILQQHIVIHIQYLHMHLLKQPVLNLGQMLRICIIEIILKHRMDSLQVKSNIRQMGRV